MIKKIKKFVLTFGILIITPFTAHGFIGSIGELENTLDRIVGFMQSLLFGLAAVFLILAGYKFMTAAGDEEKFKEGKKMLAYTVAAIIVGILATGITGLIGGILGAP